MSIDIGVRYTTTYWVYTHLVESGVVKTGDLSTYKLQDYGIVCMLYMLKTILEIVSVYSTKQRVV